MKVLGVGDLHVAWGRARASARPHLSMTNVSKRQFPSDRCQGDGNEGQCHFRPEIDRHVILLSVFRLCRLLANPICGSGCHGHVVRDAETLPSVTSLINKMASLPVTTPAFGRPPNLSNCPRSEQSTTNSDRLCCFAMRLRGLVGRCCRPKRPTSKSLREHTCSRHGEREFSRRYRPRCACLVHMLTGK